VNADLNASGALTDERVRGCESNAPRELREGEEDQMSLMDQITSLFKGGKGENLLKGLNEMVSSGQVSLSKMLDNFKSAGMGDKVDSWVGTGPNKAVTADEVKQAADPDNLQAIANKAGISVDEAAEEISKTLPEVVDKLTPDGVLPSDDQVRSKLSGV
jgi:uncharacterized protein YidB (DUF937 family)